MSGWKVALRFFVKNKWGIFVLKFRLWLSLIILRKKKIDK